METQKNEIIRIGHRGGASGYEPENTLSSVKKALELKVDMIEIDVQLSKDNELVVIHDITLDRTTNAKGYVALKTSAELKQLDAGKGNKIPLLKEILDFVNRKVKINIELKGHFTPEPVVKLIEYYVNNLGWKYDDFIVSCFDFCELDIAQKLNSNIIISGLFDVVPEEFNELIKKFKFYSAHLNRVSVTKEFIEHAHTHGIKVFSFTVNRPNDIDLMKSLGIDGLFSDYPDKIN